MVGEKRVLDCFEVIVHGTVYIGLWWFAGGRQGTVGSANDVTGQTAIRVFDKAHVKCTGQAYHGVHL